MIHEARDRDIPPQRHVVYAVVDPRDFQVRYVGQTGGLYGRMSAHRSAGTASVLLSRILRDTRVKAPFFTLRVADSSDNLSTLEREEIMRAIWCGSDLLNRRRDDRPIWGFRSFLPVPGPSPWTSLRVWRRAVQEVPCPECGKGVGRPCGVSADPLSNHHRRIAAYLRAEFPQCTGRVERPALRRLPDVREALTAGLGEAGDLARLEEEVTGVLQSADHADYSGLSGVVGKYRRRVFERYDALMAIAQSARMG